MVLFVGAESGSVLVFVEVKLLVGFGFCKSLKVGILHRTYEKVSRPGPCNFNGDPQVCSLFPGFKREMLKMLIFGTGTSHSNFRPGDASCQDPGGLDGPA